MNLALRSLPRRWAHPIVASLLAISNFFTNAASGVVPDVAAEFAFPISNLEQRLKQNPNDYVSETALIQLYTNVSKRTGDLSYLPKSVPRLDSILAEMPGYAPALILRCTISMTLHEFSRAEELALVGLQLRHGDSAFGAMLADARFEQGKYDEAFSGIEESLRAHPEDPTLLVRLSRFRQFQGRLPEAEKLLHQAVAMVEKTSSNDPFNLAWYDLALGRFYFAVGDFEKAEQAYIKARNFTPDWWTVKDHFAELRGAQTRYGEGVQLFKDAFELSKRSEEAHAIGDLLMLSGDSKAADEWFSKADDGYKEAESNGFIYYLHHRAHLFSDSRTDPPLAISLSEKDLSLRMTADAYDQLAWSLYKAGDLDRAKEMSDKGMKHGEHVPHILYHTAMIRGALGDIKGSKILLEKAASINPKFMQFHVHR